MHVYPTSFPGSLIFGASEEQGSGRRETLGTRLMYTIHQTGDKITQTYQVEDVTFLQHQILVTNLQGNVQQLEGRISNWIKNEKVAMSLQ